MNKNKIAVLGNMNNAGFVLMRHLRDLGEDAHLLLYKNDGVGYSSHFSLESDSWDEKKWQPYIHNLPISNSYGAALSNSLFLKIILFFAFYVRIILGSQNAELTRPASKKEILEFKKILSKYDKFFGSGSSPAIFAANELTLDIFFPYSMGIENFNEKFFLKLTKSKNFIIKLIASKMRNLQRQGIVRSKIAINADISVTKKAYDELGIEPIYVYPPHLYKEKSMPEKFSKKLKEVLNKIEQFDYSLISHSRHQWKRPSTLSKKEFSSISKNNDWLIKGFSAYLEISKKNPILILFEYGIDYQDTKSLIHDLKIQDNVYWLPLMKRKEILEVINACDVGIGEFYEDNITMGSTGYEILTLEKPLIQGPLDSNEFTKITKIPRPPGIFVSTPKEIKNAFLSLEDDNYRKSLGSEGLKWIQEYSSFANTKKLIEFLQN